MMLITCFLFMNSKASNIAPPKCRFKLKLKWCNFSLGNVFNFFPSHKKERLELGSSCFLTTYSYPKVILQWSGCGVLLHGSSEFFAISKSMLHNVAGASTWKIPGEKAEQRTHILELEQRSTSLPPVKGKHLVVAPPPQPSDPVNGTPPLGGQVQPVSCALATCAASRNTAFAIKIGKLLWSLRMGANIWVLWQGM